MLPWENIESIALICPPCKGKILTTLVDGPLSLLERQKTDESVCGKLNDKNGLKMFRQ